MLPGDAGRSHTKCWSIAHQAEESAIIMASKRA